MRVPLVAANWKMHKTPQEARRYVTALKRKVAELKGVEVALAPPFVALEAVSRELVGTAIRLAAQDVYPEDEGPFTGEVSPPMLKSVGCRYVIVGHSERRGHFGEDDSFVNRKLLAAWAHGLVPILCVGETLAQREANQTWTVLEAQLRAGLQGLSPEGAARLVIAYEPIWAIGTGKTATPQDAQAGCAFVRGRIRELFSESVARSVRVQYGGSVTPDNAAGLFPQPDIDGALVGGASLDPESFAEIAQAAVKSS